MALAATRTEAHGLTLYYDGECPVCRSYVTRVRLRRTVGKVTLVDLRTHPETRRRLEAEGYLPDEGMVVEVAGQGYHGPSAVQVLALLSSRSGLFNRLNYRLFGSARASRLLYPLLVAGRRALLFLLGRKPLTHGDPSSPDNPTDFRKVS